MAALRSPKKSQFLPVAQGHAARAGTPRKGAMPVPGPIIRWLSIRRSRQAESLVGLNVNRPTVGLGAVGEQRGANASALAIWEW